MILMLFAISCKTVNFNCYRLVTYTKEEQQELDNILKENNNKTLNKIIIDYYNLRQNIKSCQNF